MKDFLILTPFYAIFILISTVIVMNAQYVEKKLKERIKKLE